MIESTVGSVGSRIEFDSSGDMVSADYKILNLQKKKKDGLVEIGSWSSASEHDPVTIYNNDGDNSEGNVMWIGGTTSKPDGYEMPTHLRVGTGGSVGVGLWVCVSKRFVSREESILLTMLYSVCFETILHLGFSRQ